MQTVEKIEAQHRAKHRQRDGEQELALEEV
jgi:hypothetical protein